MMRALAAALLLATGGCSAIFGLEGPAAMSADGDGGLDGGGLDDADTNGDASADANLCFGTGLYTVCLAAAPSGSVALTTINTDTDPRCSAEAADVCLVTGTTITTGAASNSIRAQGTRPLVLLATNEINITTNLDAGSRMTPTIQIGAGAAGVDMCPIAGAGAASANGAGGGAGGSFHTMGGNGGRGANGGGPQASAGNAVALPTTLRGGCRGATGGDDTAQSGGAGGYGGGAVYLIANVVTIGAMINVGGAGGEGAHNVGGGGGGGGTGGLIGIDAPSITCSGTARLLANGGGGGEGGGTSGAGASGTSAADVAAGAAVGGRGAEADGGDGGNGSQNSSQGNPGQNGTADNSGGGGGGGGGGFIKVYQGGSLAGCSVSPPAI